MIGEASHIADQHVGGRVDLDRVTEIGHLSLIGLKLLERQSLLGRVDPLDLAPRLKLRWVRQVLVEQLEPTLTLAQL